MSINNVTIKIEDYEGVVVYSKLIVEQPVLEHHRFSFVWNYAGFRSNAEEQLNVIRNHIGKKATITFTQSNIFIGIITSISIEENSNASQLFIISGQSPTFLLEDTPRTGSYLNKNLGHIIKKTINNTASNVLPSKISPSNNIERPYIVQYNETNFRFLCRLAVKFGEWFYYNGKDLVFGELEDSNTTLLNGADLDSFTINANLQSNNFRFSGYDYTIGEEFSVTLNEPLEVSGINTLASDTARVSQEVYGTNATRGLHAYSMSSQAELNDLLTIHGRGQTANLITVKGESRNQNLKAGTKFKITNHGNTSEYIAISVIHRAHLPGHYRNSFIAIPASVQAPPYTDVFIIRQSGVQSGIVKENHDTEGLGRVKVHFGWQLMGSDTTPWIRVATPHAGSGRGMHFTPEKGEEVIVDFEGGDVERPFVNGSMFHGNGKPLPNNPCIKSLSTANNLLVQLHDCDKVIKIFNPFAGKIEMGDDIITIISNSKIRLVSTSIELEGDTISFRATQDINLSASNNITLRSENEKIHISAGGNAEVYSRTGDINIGANQKAHLAGQSINIDGTGETIIKGASVKLNP